MFIEHIIIMMDYAAVVDYFVVILTDGPLM